VAIASSACVFVSFASLLVYTFGVFLKPLTEQFGWSRQAASAAFGIAALAVAACSPFIGHLLDRYPARRIILPSVAVFGCAFASLSLLTRHLWHFYAIFLVLGIVGNGTAHLAYSRVLTTWFDERRGVAFAVVMTGGAIGAMVLPPLAEALIRAEGWRWAYAILGAMILGVGLPLGSLVRQRPTPARIQQTMVSGLSAAEGLRTRVFWIIVVMLFAVSLSQNGAITHLSALLTDRGISPGRAAWAMSAMGAAILGGRMITGWLLDRAQSLAMGITGAVLIGFGMGGEGDVTPYLVAKYFGLRSFATLYGFTWTAYAIAGAIGPVIMGKAFDATHSYQALLSQLALLTLAAATLMLFLPKYRVFPMPEELTLTVETPAKFIDSR
jgi:MFS family permease